MKGGIIKISLKKCVCKKCVEEKSAAVGEEEDDVFEQNFSSSSSYYKFHYWKLLQIFMVTRNVHIMFTHKILIF